MINRTKATIANSVTIKTGLIFIADDPASI